jgi:hypothetical protein
MDAELVAFLFIGGVILFALLSFARDGMGQRYGFRRMVRLWLATIPYFTAAAFEFHVKSSDGTTEHVTITYASWFLVTLPIVMIYEKVMPRR